MMLSKEWDGFLSRVYPALIHDLEELQLTGHTRHTNAVLVNMTAAWRIMLRYRDAAISRFLFSIGALMVHPSFQDLLLLSDIAVLTPDDLYSLMLKLEDAIVDWLTAVDEVMILQLALMYLHPAAVSYPDAEDLWKWGRRRPPATIFDSVDDYRCRNTECFNDLNFHRPLAMWSTDEAFVEVKCSVCNDVFVTVSAAVRHFNTTQRCLPTFQEKPDCLTVQRSLSSVALIVVSGRDLSETKADEMDDGWDVFVCVCCELRHDGDMFLGTWRACVCLVILLEDDDNTELNQGHIT
ncbi:hypothetical protein AAF712_012691 [Marasmius tenuissimus]|uniref:C2H2-type domain-containing protein n=1 Tax=Marasmius tenuissimus TaxID=585030 RepID=A0ABR2ZFR1_9AGAR